ncbi:MAG TPA: gamma-glutamyltransferase [Gaiellales bacterium]|nr:gamma-glutamyltransferase [Gaiellales bacterium]
MNGAIAAGHELTARAGAEVLSRGGNAVDAAVAAAAMSWAAEPPLTGPCGGGFFLVRPARGRAPALLDAFTSIPGRDLPPGRRLTEVDEVLVPFDQQTTQVFHAGPAACAVPGVVAGMAAVHGRYGSLPWRSLLLPAAEAADLGVATNAGQQRVFAAIEAILTRLPESRELFSPGGRFVEVGTVFRQAELARSIELLAERGSGELYTGALARAMVADQERLGGRLTMPDLAAYRPVWRRPLAGSFEGHALRTNCPPSSGGVLIAYMLAVLAAARPAGEPGSAPALRALAETMRAAARLRGPEFARRLHRGGLSGHALAPEAVEDGRRSVERALQRRPVAAASAIPSDHGTTHISVVDDRGNAVGFTASNGSHSGVIVPGTGLHLNNMLGEEDLVAGRHLAPGNRLTSMQAPTMVERGGRLEMVVGSSGSNRLRSAITQVIVNVLRHGMSLRDAVSFPRVHVEGDRLDCEGGIDAAVVEELERWGERPVTFGGLNLYFGGANAVSVGADGSLDAAGDPRRDCYGIVL